MNAPTAATDALVPALHDALRCANQRWRAKVPLPAAITVQPAREGMVLIDLGLLGAHGPYALRQLPGALIEDVERALVARRRRAAIKVVSVRELPTQLTLAQLLQRAVEAR